MGQGEFRDWVYGKSIAVRHIQDHGEFRDWVYGKSIAVRHIPSI